MRTGILAKKIGMSSYYSKDGSKFPVTLLYVEDCEVTNIRTIEKNNYSAVQIGIININPNKVNNPQKGSITKLKAKSKKFTKEFRVPKDHSFTIGTSIKVDHFEKGQFVDVTSISKGKGFSGAMKRHNFSGLRASHGVSASHRAHGSTGHSQDPGRVFKGKKMAGHQGFNQVTIQNLSIIDIDNENNILIVKGSVPGSENTIVSIKDSVKKVKAK